MADELKSMFRQNELTPEEVEEKQRYELEMQKKRDLNKKQTGNKKVLMKLIGGLPTIVPLDSGKQGQRKDRNIKWVWSPFSNQARKDDLRLYHWIKKDDSNTNKDYEYAQYNKKISIVEFNQYEYETFLKDLDPCWTFEETLYLWELCRQYDLRFIVIQDRYDEKYNRTIEELKHRYYTIAKRLLEQRKDYDHPILKSGYNYEQEMKRRACLERMISRSKEENLQENNILKQSLEVEKRIEKYEKFENELKNLSDETKFNMTFEEYVKSNASEMDSFVYLRSNKMKYNLPVSEKIQKKVESLLKELQIPDKLIPTNAIEQSYDNLRNNLIILTSLRKHLDKKEREFIKLNHINNELQNKYAAPRSVINNQNIPNQNNLGNLNAVSAANGNNIINNASNVTLSLHESNDMSQMTNLTNKDRTKKSNQNLNTVNNASFNSSIPNGNLNTNKLIRKKKHPEQSIHESNSEQINVSGKKRKKNGK